MPTRKICPISRIAIFTQGQCPKGGIAADKPRTTIPAISATSVSREGCHRKSFGITVFIVFSLGLLSIQQKVLFYSKRLNIMLFFQKRLL
jgi:hypothetical protein